MEKLNEWVFFSGNQNKGHISVAYNSETII